MQNEISTKIRAQFVPLTVTKTFIYKQNTFLLLLLLSTIVLKRCVGEWDVPLYNLLTVTRAWLVGVVDEGNAEHISKTVNVYDIPVNILLSVWSIIGDVLVTLNVVNLSNEVFDNLASCDC